MAMTSTVKMLQRNEEYACLPGHATAGLVSALKTPHHGVAHDAVPAPCRRRM
jgi:hypothetical protein